MIGVDNLKRTKMAYLVLCTLLIATLVPAVGTALPTVSDPDQPRFTAPGPGYAPAPSLDDINDIPLRRQPAQNTVSTDDAVISIIEQVDEADFLSYEQDMLANGPRPTESASCEAAAEYMYDEFESFGLDVRYHHWTNSGYESDNVEATLYGTDEESDEIFVICGHYDTVSASPGADDDTSGTIAVLMAAKILSQYQFNHTIKFVAFSGEEQGLLGSEVYAQEADSQGWNIGGVLNCDMISYAITSSDGDNMVVYENSASQWLYTYTGDINEEYAEYIGPMTLHAGGTSSGSDHYYFWQHGFSAIFYFEYEMTPYYHGPQDTIPNINISYAAKNIRLILATLGELAEARYPSDPPVQPTTPNGKTLVVWNREYSYTSSTSDPNGDQILYLFYWGDGSNSGWIGPYPSGQTGTSSHAWTAIGTYNITVKAKDINGASSPLSEALTITVTDNTPPFDPTITGPSEIKPRVAITFNVSAVDEFDHDVTFDIDWGDGNGASGLGPYHSGEVAELTHTWAKRGTYKIKVKATDQFGMESNWTYLEVVCPTEYRIPVNSFLQHLFEMFPHAFPLLRRILG
jgi:hypothetical protein